MKIKMVATDLDGTLLGRDIRVSPRNARALKTCLERGIRVVFASGRSFESARLFAKDVGAGVSVLCFNGSAAYETTFGSLAFCKYMAEDTAREVYRRMKDSGEYFVCCTPGVSYMSNLHSVRGHKNITGAWGEDGFLQASVDDDAHLLTRGVTHANKFVSFSDDWDAIARLRKNLEGLPVSLSSSWPDNVEVLPEGVTKGGGLIELAARFGVAPDEIMAFGDYENDRTMLDLVGRPVVMENGQESLKIPGRAVAPAHWDDGVGRYLEAHVL